MVSGILDLLNQPTVLIVIVYLIIEAVKVYLPHKERNDKAEEHSRDEVTEAVFKLYDITKSDLESDKTEIRELTKLLKRANLEITLLERKIAALMRVMDSVLKSLPEVQEEYKKSMNLYKHEVDELTTKIKGDRDFD